MSHTPTPWKRLDDENFREDVLGADGVLVCSFEQVEDASFAVRACNAHDALLAAAKRPRNNMVELMQSLSEYTTPEDVETTNALEAAIALAEKS